MDKFGEVVNAALLNISLTWIAVSTCRLYSWQAFGTRASPQETQSIAHLTFKLRASKIKRSLIHHHTEQKIDPIDSWWSI